MEINERKGWGYFVKRRGAQEFGDGGDAQVVVGLEERGDKADAANSEGAGPHGVDGCSGGEEEKELE